MAARWLSRSTQIAPSSVSHRQNALESKIGDLSYIHGHSLKVLRQETDLAEDTASSNKACGSTSR
jgi:hypothetical protein